MTGTDELTNRSDHSVTEKDELNTNQFNIYISERKSYKQIRSISTEG
jgi:hypothetical protein